MENVFLTSHYSQLYKLFYKIIERIFCLITAKNEECNVSVSETR